MTRPQMSSHFATSTAREKTPAYCKKWQFREIPALIAERPATMNVLASWKGLPADPTMDVINLFRIYYDAIANEWTGELDGDPYGFRAQVILYAPPTTWLINLELTVHGTPAQSAAWQHDQPDPSGRWNSGPLGKVITPPNHIATVHILA